MSFYFSSRRMRRTSRPLRVTMLTARTGGGHISATFALAALLDGHRVNVAVSEPIMATPLHRLPPGYSLLTVRFRSLWAFYYYCRGFSSLHVLTALPVRRIIPPSHIPNQLHPDVLD